VSLPGFGTFSFVQKKIDIGNSKLILVQRPVFSIAEKFAQTHGLHCTKYPVAGNIPVHPLNYASIANETAFTRDDVETCVKHILHCAVAQKCRVHVQRDRQAADTRLQGEDEVFQGVYKEF
jgi:hypothetical protein